MNKKPLFFTLTLILLSSTLISIPAQASNSKQFSIEATDLNQEGDALIVNLTEFTLNKESDFYVNFYVNTTLQTDDLLTFGLYDTSTPYDENETLALYTSISTTMWTAEIIANSSSLLEPNQPIYQPTTIYNPKIQIKAYDGIITITAWNNNQEALQATADLNGIEYTITHLSVRGSSDNNLTVGTVYGTFYNFATAQDATQGIINQFIPIIIVFTLFGVVLASVKKFGK